jgi:hypothetical protein
MPQKVWAVGEEVLAADFNNYVQNQVVAQFPNVAARTAAIAAPVGGQASYIDSGDANEGPEFWNGAAWRKPWNMPWGVVAQFTVLPANLVTVGTTELVLFTTPAFNAPGNRRYKLTCEFTGLGTEIGNSFLVQMRRPNLAGTIFKFGPTLHIAGASYQTPFSFIGFDLPPANAAQTYVQTVQRTSGNGTFTALGGTHNNSMTVEDVGPAAAGAPT